jgi:hypothetical protein
MGIKVGLAMAMVHQMHRKDDYTFGPEMSTFSMRSDYLEADLILSARLGPIHIDHMINVILGRTSMNNCLTLASSVENFIFTENGIVQHNTASLLALSMMTNYINHEDLGRTVMRMLFPREVWNQLRYSYEDYVRFLEQLSETSYAINATETAIEHALNADHWELSMDDEKRLRALQVKTAWLRHKYDGIDENTRTSFLFSIGNTEVHTSFEHLGY